MTRTSTGAVHVLHRLPGQLGACDPDVRDQQHVPAHRMVRSTWCSSMAAANAGAAR